MAAGMPVHNLSEVPDAAAHAQVATLIRADWLVLLTDVDALYTANPATDPDAQPIYEVTDLSQLHVRIPAG